MADCNCKYGTNGIATACPECDIPQLARNNYFTGKLLVERDFTDEQRYTLGKLRRHNQRLHGWGAVCGLKVKQHPNPACQSQYVLIEPGTAIDCCGREILLDCAEYFDFESRFLAKWQQQQGPGSQPDPSTVHTLQVCISYKECNTENVPALFDDCNAGGATCQPNRILESHDFDVLIDPAPSATDPQGVQIEWAETIGIDNVVRVAESPATSTLYALASAGGTATLYAVDSANGSITAAASFANNAGLDIGVSPAGDFVFLALQPTIAGAAPQILVLAASALTTPFNTLPITSSTSGDAIRLAVAPAPDGRLFAVVPGAGAVLIWNTDIELTTGFAAPQSLAVGSKPVGIAIDSGLYAYVANSGDSSVTAIALSSLTPTTVTTGLAGAAPAAIAVATTTAGDTLAVLDTTASTLYLISIPSSGPGSATALGNPVTPFGNKPLDLQISPGGRWVYVLEQDASTPPKGYLQVVDAQAVATGQPNVLSNPVSIAVSPENELLSASGILIYAPYQGNAAGSVPGAIAVIDVTQYGCPDLFKCALEACPDCTQGNCIVLATIQGYTYQGAVTDSAIDNWTDRQILASTELLTRVVRCILDQGGSATPGPQGPQGLPGLQGQAGTNGAGITGVTATFVTCDTPGSATLTGPPVSQTLNLTIPGCCNNALVGIKGISWQHNKQLPLPLLEQGLKIAFSDAVQADDLTSNTIVLLMAGPVATGLLQWREAAITVTAGNFASTGDVTSAFAASTSPTVNGLSFVLSDPKLIFAANVSSFRVLVKGDFIRDATAQENAVDGDHLPPWLPTRTTGDGIAGGTFESWFTLVE